MARSNAIRLEKMCYTTEEMSKIFILLNNPVIINNFKKLKCDLTWTNNFSDKYNQRRIFIALVSNRKYRKASILLSSNYKSKGEGDAS